MGLVDRFKGCGGWVVGSVGWWVGWRVGGCDAWDMEIGEGGDRDYGGILTGFAAGMTSGIDTRRYFGVGGVHGRGLYTDGRTDRQTDIQLAVLGGAGFECDYRSNSISCGASACCLPRRSYVCRTYHVHKDPPVQPRP